MSTFPEVRLGSADPCYLAVGTTMYYTMDRQALCHSTNSIIALEGKVALYAQILFLLIYLHVTAPSHSHVLSVVFADYTMFAKSDK